ncbi:HAMP domain-containing sensor histidine kinase [Lysinibacillus sp. Bpr_S20]|uniref:HAMP domain-containing sensor histidine kinase n=1 Tax=Lysinibacillus sp. Bpr_S20 TaxID=2933964 RepID=UPI002011730B|nr:HAMP domain-containing sensor histidine kinase [Lysinibacillus sp. Bpr_S20]MCL1699069.1 HAMP domain-containing histidine kinase [Lysinibacillus sp. Bpr_S20]
MRRLKNFLKLFLTLILLLIISIVFALISYHITSWLYDWLGKYPQGFWLQLWTVVGVFVLFACSVIITFLIGSKRQRNYWNTIVDALSRIAKGDFTVKLDLKTDDEDQFGQLIHGINHMAVELGEIERMRQEFISNVSHEIQSPLTSINGFAKALKNIDLPEDKRQHYLAIIEMESNRLSKISDNLLKLTSLESQHHPFEPRHYRLDKQLRNVVLTLEANWLAKNIDMDLQLENISLMADEDLMNQVWMNLLSNSIKFTPVAGTITISMTKQIDSITITICDNGIGLTTEQQKHVFERFYKADQSRTAENGGSGLGLSIVKKIIDMHNGTITVESKLAEFTTFFVTLPLEINETHANA